MAAIHVQRVADLGSAGVGEIAYVEDEKFFAAGRASQASCLIAPRQFVVSLNDSIAEHEFGPALIEVAKPKLAFALIAALLHPPKSREPFVHPTAVLAETADVDLKFSSVPMFRLARARESEQGRVSKPAWS